MGENGGVFMKRILCLIFMACMTLFLFGCDENSAPQTDSTAPDIAANENTDANNTENTEIEANGETGNSIDNGGFSDAEMKSIYEAADRVWQVFDLKPLTTDIEQDENGVQKFYTVNGITGYAKVNDSRYHSLTALIKDVNVYFSEDLAAKLLNDGRYVEEDGVFYELLADRGSDITRGDIIKQGITAQDENSLTYTVTVETIDPNTGKVVGNEDIDFLYEKTGSSWVFTQFESIY